MVFAGIGRITGRSTRTRTGIAPRSVSSSARFAAQCRCVPVNSEFRRPRMSSEIPASVPLLAAAIGAAAALLGTALSFGRDWYGQRLKDGEQRTFVAMRLAADLEDFAIRCALAAGDRGEPEIQAHGQEEYVPRHSTPDFTLDYSAYEWRLVPKDLLMRVLELPHLAQRAHAFLDGVSEFVAGPPYYEEFFQERSLRFGRLGLRSLDLARDLRTRHGAPPSLSTLDPDDDYDIRNHLESILSEVEKSRVQSRSTMDA